MKKMTARERELYDALKEALPLIYAHRKMGCKGDCDICQTRARITAVLAKF